MNISTSIPNGPTSPAAGSEDARLRKACAQLEGVFMQQLLKVMRETVPEGGVVSGGSAEEIFSSLMDQHIAEQAAARASRGLGAALYERLRSQVGQEGAAG